MTSRDGFLYSASAVVSLRVIITVIRIRKKAR